MWKLKATGREHLSPHHQARGLRYLKYQCEGDGTRIFYCNQGRRKGHLAMHYNLNDGGKEKLWSKAGSIGVSIMLNAGSILKFMCE